LHSRHIKPEPLLDDAVKPHRPVGGREAADLRALSNKDDTRAAVMAFCFDLPRLACFFQNRASGIEPKEQVTNRASQQIRDPPACHVM
jgi:hypothetical protein